MFQVTENKSVLFNCKILRLFRPSIYWKCCFTF